MSLSSKKDPDVTENTLNQWVRGSSGGVSLGNVVDVTILDMTRVCACVCVTFRICEHLQNHSLFNDAERLCGVHQELNWYLTHIRRKDVCVIGFMWRGHTERLQEITRAYVYNDSIFHRTMCDVWFLTLIFPIPNLFRRDRVTINVKLKSHFTKFCKNNNMHLSLMRLGQTWGHSELKMIL